jgi:hypothetical protein
LVSALVEQGVEVHRLDQELHLMTLGNRGAVYNDLRQNPPTMPAGSYLIFLAQPYRANIKTLFEKQIYPDRPHRRSARRAALRRCRVDAAMQLGVQALSPFHS